LYEHCIRAIDLSLRTGSHGLPLMGSGDWNDGMNRVGAEGKGESVWLAWFLVRILEDFAELCSLQKDPDCAMRYRKSAKAFKNAIERNAWDGQWYLRAFNDDGTALGSKQNDECSIDSIPQTWSVLANGAGDQHSRTAMDSVAKNLIDPEHG